MATNSTAARSGNASNLRLSRLAARPIETQEKQHRGDDSGYGSCDSSDPYPASPHLDHLRSDIESDRKDSYDADAEDEETAHDANDDHDIDSADNHDSKTPTQPSPSQAPRPSALTASPHRILSAPTQTQTATPTQTQTQPPNPPPRPRSWLAHAQHLARQRAINGEAWTPAHVTLARTKTVLFLSALAQAKADEREAAAARRDEMLEDLQTRSVKALHEQGMRGVSREERRARRRVREQVQRATSERERRAINAEWEEAGRAERCGRSRSREQEAGLEGRGCAVQVPVQEARPCVRWAKLPSRADTL